MIDADVPSVKQETVAEKVVLPSVKEEKDVESCPICEKRGN